MAINPTWDEMELVRSEKTPVTFDDIANKVTGSAIHYELWNRWLREGEDRDAVYASQFVQLYDSTPKPLTTESMGRLWMTLDFCNFDGHDDMAKHLNGNRFTDRSNWDDDTEQTYVEELSPRFERAADELRAVVDAAVPRYREALHDEMLAAVDSRAGQGADGATRAAVQEINQRTIKNAEDGQQLVYRLCSELLFVGNDHPAETINYWLAYDPPSSQGWLTVQRSRFGAGSLRVTGCEPADRSRLADLIGSFSDKSLKFD